MRYLKYRTGRRLGALQTLTDAPWNVPRLVKRMIGGRPKAVNLRRR